MINKDTKFKLVVIRQKNVVYNRSSTSQVKGDIKAYYDHINAIYEAGQKRVDTIKKERLEISRLVSLANKRLKRLEQRNLTHVPAYQQFIADGARKFSVRGKSQNQLQAEKARLKNFINSTTSTIRGANEYMKKLANATGMDYKSIKDLQQKTPVFFELHSKIEQYLRTTLDMASAIDYEQIFTAINKYVETAKIDLAQNRGNIESMVKDITDALTAYEKPINIGGDSLRLEND